jgi:hypothetical protein
VIAARFVYFFFSGSQGERCMDPFPQASVPPNKGECIDVGSVAVGSLEAK